MNTEGKREHSYNHILKYTSIFGGVQGLNILIGLVRNKIVAKLLGPVGMGLASLFNSTVNFISQATNFGISFSAVRHVSELFDEGDEARIAHFVKVVRGWSLLTGLLGMLLCILLGSTLSNLTFRWGDHTLHFMLLAPAVAMLAITGGETAILKGARRLRSLAFIQLINVFVSVLISLPLYYSFGQRGIVPVIVLMAFASMVLTIWHSYRLYPLRMKGSSGILGEGMEMVRLGVAFMLAGILGSGAEMFIRTWLNINGDLNVVGLYNAGFMLTMTYGSMVFSAMETDYFPRLSAVNTDVLQSNLIVNRQIEVSVLVIGPMLVALFFATPILVPLLLTDEFLPVVNMMRFTTLALYLRAMKLPVCYMTLAKGDGYSYLLMEGIYDIAMVVLVLLGYSFFGLSGTGLALLAVALLDYIIINTYTYFKYYYRPSLETLCLGGIHSLIGLVSFVLVYAVHGWLYWFMGVVMLALSLSFSFWVLHQKTSLMNKLKSNFKNRFIGHA